MADDEDKESKTEDASEKKTRDSVEKGQKPVSRDLVGSVTLVGLFFALMTLGEVGAPRLNSVLSNLFALSGEIHLARTPDVVGLSAYVARTSLFILLPFFGIMGAAAIAAHLIQGEFRFASARLKPQASRLSLFRGFGRIFGQQGVVEFLKSAAKLIVCFAVAYQAMKSSWPTALDALFRDPNAIAPVTGRLVLRIVLSVAATMLLIGLADFLYTRFSWRQSLRMTRQEMKDEFKESDGDPLVKARLRSIALDRARRRMIQDVERATLVVVNPTHFAVALRYMRDEGGAPLVLAKGVDLIALKIRERAEALGIPVIESQPLARAMHDHVDVGQMIPAQFYQAVAEIINLLAKTAPKKAV